jgi:hypothetical protein
MPTRHRRPPTRSGRLCALAVTCAVGGGALALPSPAAAATDHFCQFATLGSGAECFAPDRRTLQNVRAWVINTPQRVCAASFSVPWGQQSSSWRCDYGFAEKDLGGGVYGVGAIHNGDPSSFVTYGTQDY